MLCCRVVVFRLSVRHPPQHKTTTNYGDTSVKNSGKQANSAIDPGHEYDRSERGTFTRS